MGRAPVLPSQLLRAPFTTEEARRAGIERWHLRGASWRRVAAATYVWSGLSVPPLQRLLIAQRRLPIGSAFSGLTAAWLHGIDVEPCNPIEATVSPAAGVSARSGIRIRRSVLAEEDIVERRGLACTGIVRTLADLCLQLTLVEAVVVADAALHLRRVSFDAMKSWAWARPSGRGLKRFRRVIDLAEPAAESPMESRLRMVLVLAGLPRPQVQISIHDHHRRFVGRLDLYYAEQRLGIEYDGALHRTSLAEDDRRQNRLFGEGVTLLRFTAADIRNPDVIISQVRDALGRRSRRATAGESAIQ